MTINKLYQLQLAFSLAFSHVPAQVTRTSRQLLFAHIRRTALPASSLLRSLPRGSDPVLARIFGCELGPLSRAEPSAKVAQLQKLGFACVLLLALA